MKNSEMPKRLFHDFDIKTGNIKKSFLTKLPRQAAERALKLHDESDILYIVEPQKNKIHMFSVPFQDIPANRMTDFAKRHNINKSVKIQKLGNFHIPEMTIEKIRISKCATCCAW